MISYSVLVQSQLYHIWTGHLTYLLTPWCRVLLETLTGLQLVKKFPAFHGTRRFITALTSVRHLSLSWASPIQSIYPHPTSWRSILILSAQLSLGLPSGLFPSGFPNKTPYTPLSSPIRATCPAHLILLDFITRTILGEECKSQYLIFVKWWHICFDLNKKHKMNNILLQRHPSVINMELTKFKRFKTECVVGLLYNWT